MERRLYKLPGTEFCELTVYTSGPKWHYGYGKVKWPWQKSVRVIEVGIHSTFQAARTEIRRRALVSLGNEILACRRRKGYNRALLAVLCKVSIDTVKRWEAGLAAPTHEHLKSLKEEIDVRIYS